MYAPRCMHVTYAGRPKLKRPCVAHIARLGTVSASRVHSRARVRVLRTPTLLIPDRLLVCRGTAACSPDLGLDICIHMCSMRSMDHNMRTQLYIARQTAHMYVQHAAVAQQHCSTTCICSSCVPLCCCAAVLRAVLLCCCDHEALTCAMSCSWVLHALFKLSVGCNVSMKCCCTCICEHCSTRAHHSTAQHSTHNSTASQHVQQQHSEA